MKKFFWSFFVVAALSFSCYAARHWILGASLEFALKKTAGKTVAYNQRSWEDGRLVYQGLSLGEKLHVEQASFDFDFHLFPIFLSCKVHLSSPTLQLDDAESDPVNLAFLLPGKFWTVKLDVSDGSLTAPDGKIYTFDFVSGSEKEEIGKVAVYQNEPLLTCGFNFYAGSLAVDFQMEQAALEKIFPLASIFYPLQQWNVLEGSASAELKGSLDRKTLTFLAGHFSLQNVRWESEDVIFAVDKTVSQIDFQGDMETLLLDTDFKGVDLFWKDLEVVRGEGSILFKPEAMPIFEAHAAVHLGALEGRADLVGQGGIHDKDSLWLEGSLDYVTANNPLKVNFSWADDGESQVLQTHVHNLGKEILNLLSGWFLNWKIEQGRLDGQMTTLLNQGIFQRLQLDKVQVHDLTLNNFSIQEADLQGSINLLSGDIEKLVLQAHEVQGEYQGMKISSASSTLSIKDNIFEPSSAFGKLNHIPLGLQLQGPISSFHASAKLVAGASEWLQLPKNSDEPPVVLELVIDRKQADLEVAGTISCAEDVVQLKGHASLSTSLWEGSFQAPRLCSTFYTPFLKALAPAVKLQGNLSLQGKFSPQGVDTTILGQDLIATAPAFQISMPGQSRELLYHYDFVQKQGRASAKLAPLQLTCPQFPHPVSIAGGDLAYEGTSLSCKGLIGQMGGIDAQGNLSAHWKDQLQVSFTSQKIQGSLKDLLAVTSHFYKLPFPVEGRFVSPPEGVQIHYAHGKYDYRFQAFLKDLQVALTPKLSLYDTSCSLVFDSFDNLLLLSNLHANLNDTLALTSQQIGFKNGAWEFDAIVAHHSQPVLSLQGQAAPTSLGYQVNLSSGKASGSYLKSPLSFLWTPSGKIEQVHGLIHLETSHLLEQLSLLDQCGLFELNSNIREVLEKLQGSMSLRLAHEADRSEYELHGSQIRYATSLFNSVEAVLFNQGNEWIVKRCSLDDIQMKGHVVYQNSKWVIPSWDIDWKDLHLQTAGVYSKEQLDFELQGHVKAFTVSGSGIYIPSIPHFKNIALQVHDQAKKVGDFSCDKLAYQGGKWESSAFNTMIFSDHLAHPLQIKFILSITPQTITFQGPATQGDMQIGKSTLKLSQIFGLYEASYLNLKCLAALDGEPLQLMAKFSPEFAGGVHVQHGNELLKISLSNPTTLQKMEGELFGMAVDLVRQNQGYSGTVTLKDTSKLADLADKEELRHVRGLQLKGYFDKGNFKGELEGQNACLKDYVVEQLHASIEYTPSQFRLKNVTLQDPAGSFSIKECIGTRLQDEWSVSIPLLKGQEIKPSAARKLGAPPKEVKPLQIRHLVMTGISGSLSDLKSFRGQGTFNFTQREKKEPSLFDIPSAILKDLGLDFGIFTPVRGEVDIRLQDGKLFLTRLQNTFSEDQRSEFYLAPGPSFIDLDGNLSLNLRMQQNVVLKLVEPFMIAVRGTWEKPQYSLQ
ncbi:MAG: hypothetical protein JSS10_05220 [Verrucomicrobia bacterium]|nr:hypothetical protein [Verrucomicrobiota bacterium]